jgi:hypothetical protein
MKLQEFADKYNLPVSVDDCGDQVIVGRHGDISAWDGRKLLASFYGRTDSKVRTMRIAATARSGYGVNFHSADVGDEALVQFSADDRKAARWFIKALGIGNLRLISDEARTKMVAQLERARRAKAANKNSA